MTRRTLAIGALLLTLAMLATACAPTNTAPTPSPTVEQSPSPEPETSPEASPEVSPEASPAGTTGNAQVFRLVGEAAEIVVGTAQVREAAYYTGEGEDTMVFPLAEVCKALGWSVTESSATGQAEMRISKAGAETVTVSYTKPDANRDAVIEDAKVVKAGRNVDTGMHPFAYINGFLYGTEVFFDKAIQEIEVKNDGDRKITIETKI